MKTAGDDGLTVARAHVAKQASALRSVTGVSPSVADRTAWAGLDSIGGSRIAREIDFSRPERTASDEPTLIRNQQVSGSNPLVGSISSALTL